MQWNEDISRARELYWSAVAEADSDKGLQLFEQGRDLAERARMAKPDNPGAVLWWAANEGAVAERKKNLSSLGSIKRIEKALLALHESDPGYGYAAAARVLGNLYWRAPGFISIGSSRKAEKFLREAVESSPDFPGNRLGLADFLLDEGKREEARKLALAVAGSPAWKSGRFGQFEPERPEWKRLLEKILSETAEAKS